MKQLRRLTIWGAGILIAGSIAFAILWICCPLPKEKLHPESSTIVYSRDGVPLRVFLTGDEKYRIQVPIHDMSAELLRLVVAYEDRYFYRHPGVNIPAILRAAVQNISSKSIVSGASTITMQVARMMEPRPRTVGAKLIEMFRALQIEAALSKEEILERYLNMTPYGGNIEGIGAAAMLYFGKSSSELSYGEAALLAVIPNSPSRLRPDRNPENARAAQLKLLQRLLSQGIISPSEYSSAQTGRIPTGLKPLPFQAPHVTRRLKSLFPGTAAITSSISLPLQHLAETVVKRHARANRGLDIGQSAVVIIDNASGEVLAHVGSVNFFDTEYEGQVDGVTSPRSPGSTLKPFVYALGIDRGLVSPGQMVSDVPVAFDSYAPENYDATFRGFVSLRDALGKSLNIPAVNMLARLGNNGLYPLLKSLEISTVNRPESDYGLAMVLGGCEMTLLELTALYRSIAVGGEYLPPIESIQTRDIAPTRIFSKATAYIITDILSEVNRPDVPWNWDFAHGIPKVSWKTGTSYGHKDAWSVGYNPTYTVGVWAGNFDASGAPELVGNRIAAPILFDIFDNLPNIADTGWFQQPDTVQTREVCALSGMPAGTDCPHRKNDLYIPGVSPVTPCTLHTGYDIDQDTGYRLCSRCRENKRYRRAVYTRWPPDIAGWLLVNGYPVDDIPEHNPLCTAPQSGAGPLIVSPSRDTDYIIRRGTPLRYQQIKLEASPSNDASAIYWFVDGVLLYSGPADGQVFYTPKAGRHEFVCSDNMGRSSSVTITIGQ